MGALSPFLGWSLWTFWVGPSPCTFRKGEIWPVQAAPAWWSADCTSTATLFPGTCYFSLQLELFLNCISWYSLAVLGMEEKWERQHMEPWGRAGTILSLLSAVPEHHLCAETRGSKTQTRAFLQTAIDINVHIHTAKLDQQMGILFVGIATAFHKAKMKLQHQKGQ